MQLIQIPVNFDTYIRYKRHLYFYYNLVHFLFQSLQYQSRATVT
jgi:hypothetical protein